MLNKRIIPCLLLKGKGLVKTINFKNETYIGDPINAIRIFNEKEVDELVFLDIMASRENRIPDFDYIKKLAGECFMPLAYGGGVKSVGDIANLIRSGVEKIIISTTALTDPEFIENAVSRFGSSTIVGCIDVRKNIFGKYEVWVRGGTKNTHRSVFEVAGVLASANIGELIINNIDLDGTMRGFDIPLMSRITQQVGMPVTACGGAGNLNDIKQIFEKAKVSAVAAGSIFVFQGKHKAVLITYPSQDMLSSLFAD